MDPRELNKIDDMNVKKDVAQFNEYFGIYCKGVKKMKKNKSAQIFLILKYVIERFKTSQVHYQKVLV